MLAYREDNRWIAWAGQPRALQSGPTGEKGDNAGDEPELFSLPPSAEDEMSASELALYGLFKVAVEQIPEGHIPVFADLVDVDGSPHLQRTFEPIAPEIPDVVSDRQFFQRLANMGLITELEAEDAVSSGVIPAAMLALVEELPEDRRFAARMFLKGATTFRRDHEMTATIGSLYGMDSAAIDDLWRQASLL
jgi:hypothetical protein